MKNYHSGTFPVIQNGNIIKEEDGTIKTEKPNQ